MLGREFSQSLTKDGSHQGIDFSTRTVTLPDLSETVHDSKHRNPWIEGLNVLTVERVVTVVQDHGSWLCSIPDMFRIQ